MVHCAGQPEMVPRPDGGNHPGGNAGKFPDAVSARAGRHRGDGSDLG